MHLYAKRIYKKFFRCGNYTVRYIIRAMYDVVDAEGFSTLKQEIIEDVTMTDKEIEEAGGTSKVLASFKERFAPLCCN